MSRAKGKPTVICQKVADFRRKLNERRESHVRRTADKEWITVSGVLPLKVEAGVQQKLRNSPQESPLSNRPLAKDRAGDRRPRFSGTETIKNE